MKMKAAVIDQPGSRFQFAEVDVDDMPREDEVLVKIYACSICHSDEYCREEGVAVHLPAILGHEGAGIVKKAGSGVTDLKPGDHVALTVPHCGTCEFCKKGDYLSCPNAFPMQFGRPDGTPRVRDSSGKALGTFMGQGGFAEYVLCHKSSCVKVDPEIPFDIVAPVGCGFSTGAGTVLNYLRAGKEDTVAVFGCGSTGMASVMGAKLAGCKKIIAVDVVEEKLEMAKELGATHVINSKRLQEKEGYSVEVTGPEAFHTPVKYPLVEEIKKITNGKGVNFSIVTAPLQQVVTLAIFALAKHGECCVTASMPTGEIPFAFMQAGSMKVSSCAMGLGNKYEFFPYLLQKYKEGEFPIDKLLAHYKFEDLEQAFCDMAEGTAIKPVLEW